jgi:hypothetical protein
VMETNGGPLTDALEIEPDAEWDAGEDDAEPVLSLDVMETNGGPLTDALEIEPDTEWEAGEGDAGPVLSLDVTELEGDPLTDTLEIEPDTEWDAGEGDAGPALSLDVMETNGGPVMDALEIEPDAGPDTGDDDVEPALEMETAGDSASDPSLYDQIEAVQADDVPIALDFDGDEASRENGFEAVAAMADTAEFKMETAGNGSLSAGAAGAESEIAGEDDAGGDDFDLSFGIEIEERPPTPPRLQKPALAPAPASDPPPLTGAPASKAGPKKEAAAGGPVPVWKRRLNLPLSLVAAMALALVMAVGALIWGGLTPQALPPAGTGISVLDLDGRIMENAVAGPIFVVTGRVRNDTESHRRHIRVQGRLYTADNFVKTRTAYCGNALTDKDLTSLDPEILQRLLTNPAGDHRSNENLGAGRSLPFTLVFSRLPENLDVLDKYTATVDRALP